MALWEAVYRLIWQLWFCSVVYCIKKARPTCNLSHFKWVLPVGFLIIHSHKLLFLYIISVFPVAACKRGAGEREVLGPKQSRLRMEQSCQLHRRNLWEEMKGTFPPDSVFLMASTYHLMTKCGAECGLLGTAQRRDSPRTGCAHSSGLFGPFGWESMGQGRGEWGTHVVAFFRLDH